MTFANYFDAYPLVYYYFSFYLSFFFRPSEVGVGREVDRACSPPGRKEGGKCTGGGSAGSVALSVRKVREKWREPRLKGAGGGRFLPPPPPCLSPRLPPLPIQTWRKCRFPQLRSEETVRLPLNSDYLIKMM